MPIRVQLSRQRGFKLQELSVSINGLAAVKCDRSSRWGNPFNATQIAVAFLNGPYVIPCLGLNTPPSLDRCLDLFVAYAMGRLRGDPAWLGPLRGKNLACWCALPKAGQDDRCHAAILLHIANERM